MQRLLLVGCGDIALRLADKLKGKYRIFGLSRSADSLSKIRDRGLVPILGDLDDRHSLHKISGISSDIVHLAPPSPTKTSDRRTRNLLTALQSARILPQRLIYISTSGVYGDAKGDIVSEVTRVNPQTLRAKRRLDSERLVRSFGKNTGVKVSILRVSGIYSKDRLPKKRLAEGIPMINTKQDTFSNHIHVQDLVNTIAASLRKGDSGRCYNVSDNSCLKVGEYYDLVANFLGLKKPRRVTYEQARAEIPASVFSFIKESRILDNRRLRDELLRELSFPTVSDGFSK